MAFLLRRIAALFLVPFGFVLLVYPPNTERWAHEEDTYLFFERVAFTNTMDVAGPHIELNDVTNHPRVHAELTALKDRPLQWLALSGIVARDIERCSDASAADWVAFRHDVLGATNDPAVFLLGDKVFTGYTQQDTESFMAEIPGLRRGCLVVGIVTLLAGLWFLVRAYPPSRRGIAVARTRDIVIWDAIVILLGLFFVYGFADWVFMTRFGAEEATEEFLRFMGVFWVCFAVPVVSLIATGSIMQHLCINAAGIASLGLFGKKQVNWDEITELDVADYHSGKPVGGVMAPKRVLRLLKVRAESGTINIMEPPSRSTKRRILGVMQEHAPERLQGRLVELDREW